MNAQIQPRLQTPGFVQGSFRILLLEDCEFDRKRFSRMVNKVTSDADIIEVSSLKQLQIAANKEVFDLVVLDYFLPTGTAEHAVAELQSSKLNKKTRPVIVSGNLNPKIALKSYQMGCRGYYEKAKLSPDLLAKLIMPETERNNLNRSEYIRQLPAGSLIGLDIWSKSAAQQNY